MELAKLQNGSDIRGIAIGEGANLTEEVVKLFGRAFVRWLGKEGPNIAVGMDSRISGPVLKKACIEGFMSEGANVLDCGLASTPAMFMTTVTEGINCDGAVMLTASHLPSNRNGLKFFTNRGGLEKEDIKKIIEIAESLKGTGGKNGSVQKVDFMKIYSAQLVDKVREATGEVRPLEDMKVIVDAGNGNGGFYVAQVLTPLGAETAGSQFLEPDGNFPNHSPNPEDNAAMQSLVDAVKRENADFGIIFDTDVDRAGAVDKGGAALNKNRLIALISAILLKEFPGTTIVTDSITSSGLAEFIKELGGVHHRFKRGYKNVINESKRLNEAGQDSQIAIETSGHAALKENYFLDDGAYLVTRLIIEMARLKKTGSTLSDLISSLEESKESVEFRLDIKDRDFKAYGTKIIEELTEYAKGHKDFEVAPDNYEGVRVSLDKENGNGWFLVRLSLHDPLIPVNIESDAVGGARVIAEKLYEFLKKYNKLDTNPIWDYVKSR